MIVREMKDLFMFYESEMSFEEFLKNGCFFARISWTRQMIVCKMKYGFIFCESEKSFEDFFTCDFSIFSDSEMSCEDFFIYKKMIFRLKPPKQGNIL